MSTFALRLPDSLYAHARKLAEQDQASLNQFITVAVAEKVSALNAAAFLPNGPVRPIQSIWRLFCRRCLTVPRWRVMSDES